MQQVTPRVFVETGYRGCNPGFVVTDEGVVLIDTPQIPKDALSYREIVFRYGKPLFLINTESHGDHFTGNFFFDVPVVAQRETREAILKADLEVLKERIRLLDPDFSKALESYKIRIPQVVFEKSLYLYLGGLTIELLHLPGHTAGETAVFIPEEKVVFTGDNLFHKTQVFLHEALPQNWLESLEILKKLEAEYFIPGHGEVCGKEYLDEQAAFLKDWIRAVKEAKEKGWTLEEAKERISFLDRYPMGPGMEAFGRELQKMNVQRLYTLVEEGKL